MKTLLDFNLTAKNQLTCVIETSGHKMYCIYWHEMTQLTWVYNFHQQSCYAYKHTKKTDKCH